MRMIDILFQAFIMIGLACIGYMCGLATNRREGLRQYKKGLRDGRRERCSCTTTKSVSEGHSQSSSIP